MSRILNELIQEGYPLDPEAVAALSPFLTLHVNRFGRYSLDLDRNPIMIDYGLQVLAQVLSTQLN
jgi:Tn3 transposase DDE domain